MNHWKAIKGATLFDPSYLIDKSIQTRAELNLAEARNILNAMEKYLVGQPSARIAPFDLRWFLQLHEEMFGNVWGHAGQIRQEDKNIGVAWHQIEMLLFDLTNDLEFWTENGLDLIERSARMHHRAVYIHPFHDGNGRWARLLANIFLKRHGAAVIHWPEKIIDEEYIVRSSYLQAMRAADAGDLQPLIGMHREFQAT